MNKVNLRGVFHRLLPFIQLKSQLKNLSLTVKFDGEIPKVVYTDKRRLMQVLLNLSYNAIKYTFKGEVVIRGWMKDPTTFAVEINDTGIGIEPHLLESVFSMFGLVEKKAVCHETGTFS